MINFKYNYICACVRVRVQSQQQVRPPLQCSGRSVRAGSNIGGNVSSFYVDLHGDTEFTDTNAKFASSDRENAE